MKIRQVFKLNKRNEITSKNIDNTVMSENCDVVVIFPIMVTMEQSGSQISNA